MTSNNKKQIKNRLQSIIVLFILTLALIISGNSFLKARIQPPIYSGSGVTKHCHLSDYLPNLKKTRADSDVFVLDSGKPGGTILILGGTHPDEPAGNVAAVLLTENARIKKGRLIIIPQANRSGFTHTTPLEAYPDHYVIKTPHGDRWFRFGARYANEVDQWPDPDIYVHHPSGQRLSGSETRNLNRSYPGRPDGVLVERVAYAIRSLVVKEKVNVVVDYHEAQLEYFFINAMAVTKKSKEVGMLAAFDLSAQGIQMGMEAPPQVLHGFSYRELSDYTPAMTFLVEAANPIQGKLRGCTVASKIVTGKDLCYEEASRLGRTFVPISKEGIPLSLRVARHVATVTAIINAYSQQSGRQVVLTNVPTYNQIIKKGVGFYLASPLKRN